MPLPLTHKYDTAKMIYFVLPYISSDILQILLLNTTAHSSILKFTTYTKMWQDY